MAFLALRNIPEFGICDEYRGLFGQTFQFILLLKLFAFYIDPFYTKARRS